MTEFQAFLYDHYIQPYLEERPRDDGDYFQSTMPDCELIPHLRPALEASLGFYAVHSFFQGLRTGRGLPRE